MKVLITGGLGYLGGRLSQFLSSFPDIQVTVCSRSKTESPQYLPRIKVVKIDWGSKEQLEKICVGIDVIVHMAGMNAQDCTNDPITAIEFNAVVTARLAQAAIQADVSRFVYLSTAHVYGSPLIGNITEETCPMSLHPYATSHRAGEDVVRAAFHNNEIEGVVIRLSNAFGAPVDKGINCWTLLINDLCCQAISNGRMILKSTGLQRRDFIPITDVCNIVKHLLELPVDKLDNGVFNVGGGWSPTVKEITKRVAERFYILTGNKPSIECLSNKINEMPEILDYKINKLIDTGFSVSKNTNIDIELDKLIQFCIKNKVNIR